MRLVTEKARFDGTYTYDGMSRVTDTVVTDQSGNTVGKQSTSYQQAVSQNNLLLNSTQTRIATDGNSDHDLVQTDYSDALGRTRATASTADSSHNYTERPYGF